MGRILKYKNKKTRKFQAGGVTFHAAPTMYDPSQDYYRKEAAQNRAMQAKAASKKDTEKDKSDYADIDFISSGPEAYRSEANNLLKKSLNVYNAKVAADPDYAQSLEGITSLQNLEGMATELDSRGSRIDEKFKEAYGELDETDLASNATLHGKYVVQNKDGEVTAINPADFYENQDKYARMTTRELFSYYKNRPDINLDTIEKLRSNRSGDSFFKEKIKSLAATITPVDADGNKIPISDIKDGYESLIGPQRKLPQHLVDAGVDDTLETMWTNITSDATAFNTLKSRVWDDPYYNKQLLETPKKDRDSKVGQFMYAEMYKLAMLEHFPNMAKSGNSGGAGGAGKVDHTQGYEVYGMDDEFNSRYTVTDYTSHLESDSAVELVQDLPAAKIPRTATAIKKQQAKADKVPATLYNLGDAGTYFDMSSIDAINGTSVAKTTGMSPAEFKKKAVFRDPDSLLTVAVPSYSGGVMKGKPVIGYSEFTKEYKKAYNNVKLGSDKFALGKDSEEYKQKKRELALKTMKGSDDPKIQRFLDYMKIHGDRMTTSQKIVGEVLVSVDDIDDLNTNTQKLTGDTNAKAIYTEIDDEHEIEEYKRLSGRDADNLVVMPIMIDVVTPESAFGRGKVNPGQVKQAKRSQRKMSQFTKDQFLSQLEN